MQVEDRDAEIAVVGMSCRLPGARTPAEYWSNLCRGVESISFFTEEELLAAGTPPELVRDPSFVRAYGAMPDAFAFDAPFFGVNPAEALVMDPQQRVFLESAWSALEDAGCDPARYPGAIGVYAGSGGTAYQWRVMSNPEVVSAVGGELVGFANGKDFLTTRVSYKLGLRGPSVVVQTACSTSLVAIHMACQSLLSRECDVALAGGVTISPDQERGYRHQEGGIVSPDGHCRAFDARAGGTVSGSGVGVVVLKRMVDALRDGDTIHAVVKGSAINNDGQDKIGFTAPSVTGQAQAITEALGVAGVDPSTVSYVEAHGTGTALGDPIEIAALTEVFRAETDRKGFCALGAAKTNIGHVDSAAGVAGFIKTVLALKHRILPPTLHFERPNPETGLEDSPFYVNTELRPWERNGTPRRAGVSSFGMGGTNAHVVLEEAPEPPAPPLCHAAQLLVLSARSEDALERMRGNLAEHLAAHPGLSLADVAHTLQEGRAAHPHRWAAVARDREEACAALSGTPARQPSVRRAGGAARVAFLFPGQGTQYAGMARELYAAEPVFREQIDRCAAVLAERGMDLRAALFPPVGGEAAADALLGQTAHTQPALFAVEYALAKLWMSWGVQPSAMLGHSIGEYVAAALAGVFSPEAALRLVEARGRLMQGLEPGSMLAVPLPEAEVRPLLGERLSLAAVNSAAHCVVSGTAADTEALEARLAEGGVAARRLHTSHAFHSAAMDPVLDAFADEVRRARPAAPTTPFISNVTGDWITPGQAVDPAYWVRHLRETVRFADGAARLLEEPGRVLLEVGPGETLGTFVRRCPGGAGRVVVKSLPRAGEPGASDLTVLEAAGALWTAGVELDWAAIRRNQPRRRVPLPTYPFERTVYHVRPPRAATPAPTAAPAPERPATSASDHPAGPFRAEPMPLSPSTEPVAASCTSPTAAAVTELFARLLGRDPADLHPESSFLELGADSLLLMQASRTLETRFGVKVPFRQLLEGLSTVGVLSAHLEREAPLPVEPDPAPAAAPGRPADAPAPVVSAAPVATAAASAGNGTPAAAKSAVQEIVAQQLAMLQAHAAIMQTQLELLRGGAAPAEPNGARPVSDAASAPAPAATARVAAPGKPAEGAASHGPHRPVSQTLGEGGGYTGRQARHFDELVRRYTARTRGSKAYAAENRPVLADNRASLNFRMARKELLYPIVGERSQGSRLWDVDGNEYIDFTIGFGVHFFGHRPPFVVDAVEEQLRRGFHLGPQSDLAGPAARLFSELTGVERVTFCNTGSEAIMTAVRMARTVTGRDRIVMFEGSYHGCFDGILARGAGANREPGSRPVAPGTPQGMVGDVVVLQYGSPEALEYVRANAAVLAAVLVEPVQNRNPEFHPREFLRELRALTAASGTVLVFDEMITGLRVQRKGAQGFYGIEADLATYGKVIGGGFPLGVVAGRAAVMDAIDGGTWSYGDGSYPAANQTFFAGTFCKHPVTMAAACAVLRHLAERGDALYDELNARTARLVAALREVVAREEVPMRILSCASLFHFRSDGTNPFVDLLFYHMLERGIYIWEGRACFLSTAHTDDDCDRLVRAFGESVQELREGGFLPEKTGGGAPPAGPGGGVALPADLKLFPAPEARPAVPASFPLTPAQKQIWVHTQLGDDASRAYNEQITLVLREPLDEAALRAAVDDLARHHEALRTVFDPSGELQHVRPSLPVPFRVSESGPEGVTAAMSETLREVFDLAEGPLFRVHVHVRGPGHQVVQLVVHHLVADGFSGALLKGDLAAAYRARRAGEVPLLPQAMQFSEYAALLAGHAREQADYEEAWLARFRGTAPLAFPWDRPRPRFPTHRGGVERLRIGAGAAAAIRQAGRAQGCTLFATLLAGVLATLHRVAAQDDFVIGVPSAGRPFPGSGTLVGDCADLLPIRSVLPPAADVASFLKAVRGWLLDATEHEVFAYTRLQEKLGAPRGPGDPPLISLSFNLEPKGPATEQQAAASAGPNGAPAAELERFAKMEMVVDALELGDELELVCLFNRDLLEHGTVRRLLGQVSRVLEQMASDADAPLSALELLDDAERRLVLEEWNRTEADFPADRCLHQLFEAHAARAPRAAAVLFGGESLAYGDLDARAGRLAAHLRRHGVGPEVRVGICLERGPELVAAILGVLKAGGAYVPLDPAYPAERLGFMLASAGVSVLLTQESLRGVLPAAGGVAVVSVDGDRDAIAAESPEAVETGVEPRNLAYVIFTSGSTGVPKGIALAHRGVVNNLADLNRGWGVGADDRVLLLSSLSFDMSVYETLGILAAGGAVVVPTAAELRDPAAWAALMRDHRVTVWNSAPALLGMLVDHVEAHPADAPPALRLAFLGGDWVPVTLPDRLRAHVPGMDIVVMGGATEASIHSIIFPVGETDPAWTSIPYGVPMANQRAYVLDERLRPIPVGVPGELYLAGTGLARGYTGRPDLTAGRFLPDVQGREPGARMYRTGDLARWKADGNLELIGRLDHQVKIRGFRIETGEIESVLRRCPGVERCVVAVREDAPGDRRLIAYVVGRAQPEEMREHLRRALPEYMVPSAFVLLDEMPLSPNGKVDRKALPAPERAEGEDACVAPRTPVEEVLAGIWAEVLRLERVGAHDDFFELGGHSLLATRVVSRVRQIFAIELPLRALFEGPTLAEMAKAVEDERRRELPVLPPVVPVERTGALPLSFAQERLWFIDRLEPESAVYNIPVAWRLEGALDGAALERALGEIVRRHEALRTVFAEVDGSPVQVIAPFGGFVLPVEELSGLGETDREAAVRRRAVGEARRAFDLSAGPLFRAVLLRVSEEDHVLLLSMHHIVSDGWSMGVLRRELSALYAAYREGRESPLPELAVQYADYAVWQREQLSGEVLDRQLAYWRERLAGAPELLELPTDHPRPAVQTYRGALVPVELSAELLERLRALGRSEGATLFMTLLGAFGVLLSRYGAGHDVVVGSPIAGRTRAEVAELIGFFVNTLVLRTDLSGDPSFREVLGRVREATLGAYEHQDVPFEKLVAGLQPERSLTHSPLFQVLLTLDNGDGPGDALEGLKVSGASPALEIAKLDLTLTLAATPRGLRGGLNYSTDLFERATAERMLGHLARVLEQVAADADVRLSELELLGEAERSLILEAWNGTAAEVPADWCIHELFEAQAARTPDALAVEFQGETLGYHELNGRANRLAHHLAGLGVGPETRVAVCLERGPEMVVSVLAVLKAGGAYVPLDPAYPAERLAFMLADAAVPVLVTQESLRAALPVGGPVAVVSVDRDGARIAAEPAENPERGVSPDHLAYVIYTSGSTGTPKGVMVPHRGVPNLAYAQARRFRIDGGSRVLQFASFSFDAAVAELFDTLLAGATLVLASREELLPGAGLLETLRRGRVTVATLPPSVLAILPPDDLPELRTVVSAGEAVDAATVERWSAGRAFVNAYGPTETTVCAASADCEADGRAPAIGRALENVRVYVLDAAGRPAPVGVPGELYVGGVGVARGYLGRPGLTAGKFVPDPFGGEPGARLYRTGDRVRWRPEGVLEYLGRLDGQVKIRGFRIEAGEIEAVLRRHESVADCVVVAREDVPGEKRLVAYVVGDVEAGALREHLRRELPEYMVPAALVPLERLPLTPNGKLDRRALPAPEHAGADRYVAPRTPVEEVLAGIWEEVLGLERVGVEESFFDLGGHSLLATLVISSLRELFGVELPVRVLFEGPTVAELAKAVEEMRRAELPVLPPVVPVERTSTLPLSFAQERLWFLDRLEPGSAVYNMPAAWRLRGVLDGAALERSLGEIVRRHEALRTVFPEVDGSPVQVIAPFGGVSLPVEDLSALGEADREEAVRRRAGEEARRAFDLAAGPLFRAALLRLGEEDHVLLLSMHHIVSDGWSMGVLRRELAALYEAYREGREPPLAELAVQYADYAVWQREQLAGEVLDRQLAYWKERLAGAPELLELPTDHPRPAVRTYRGASVPVELSLELLERLQALGRSEGATLFMTLLSAFQVLLGRYAGSDDVVVGSPTAGRTRGEVQELIGFFVNTLVLRTDLSGDPGFRQVLGRVREATLAAYEHQEVPFEKLVADLQPERSLSHSPLFQVMFALQNAAGRGGAPPGLEVTEFGAELGTTKFDLALSFAVYPQGLRGVLAYSTDLFERSTVRRMLEHLHRVLEQVALKPDVRLPELELLRAEEREQVLGTWNRTERGSFDAPAHLLFAEWARRAPEAIALLEGGEAVTYGTLDRRASILARHLRGLGVVPETPVGLCMERTPELLVGVLGIWKAGGAYVPLDPGYPAERLGWILTDAAVPVVVATRGTAGVLPEHGATLVRVDQLPDTASETADAAPEVPVSDASLAYVIYTSGSTGRPKGVLVQHGSLANLLGATREAFGVGEGDVMPALASYAFDIWLFEALLPLTSGAAVRLVERERVLDVPALLEEIADATLVHAVPALMRQLVQVERERPRLSRLRRAFVGGDRVPADLLAEMREALPRAESHVLYGPTEGTILASTHPVPADGGVEGHPIGRPLGNVRLYVCDRPGSPQPAGIPGELLIGGAGVARGYLGRSAMTAERFVPDPFSTQGGTRLYRTGDRARWRADGTLEYLGRLDAQVKVRGFRIEPGEIEAVLRQHESVGECAVVVREDEVGDPRLAAYVVPVPRKDIELWPSIGEYFVYDDLIYHGLTHDTGRNERYLRALQRHAPGKVVLDVGTGADAILARLAVEAGARHVYAVELLEKSYLSARERVRELGLEDRITVIHGDARTVELPEPAEVCVSEIVEAIAGGEGAAVILNQARRLLAPGAVMIPERARTRVAAVTLPDELRHEPGFSPTAAHYVKGIFEEVGYPFDLRLCIRNFPAGHVLSTAGTYEELDFGAGPVDAEYTLREELVVERAGRMDGLLLWLRMELAEGEELDILEEETAWFPVYFPLFEPGVEVEPGDRVRLECWAQIPEGVAPDYGARGVLVRARDGEEVPFEFVSHHHSQVFRASPFYRRLFTDGEIPSLAEQRETLPASLREHVRRSLPEYMVPGAFVVLERLPLTPNGKLDRKALPAPEHAAGADRYVAPRTPVEEVLAGIWAEVLRLERVGVEESFFELGGHSLLATRVVSRVRELFGVELPLRALLEGPTVAEMAGRVDDARRAELPVLPPVVPVERTGPLPLSFAQERLWFLDRLEPGSATYNIPVAWRLAGALDERALERSLGEILRRHESLRTVFAEADGSPVQVVAPFAGFGLPVEDLSGLGEADREAAVRRRSGEEARQPFDLSAGPPFRAALLRLGAEDHVLLLSMHHIVSDGWSMGVLFRELSALYAAFRDGGESPLAELPVQYADYAVWQREQLEGEVLDRQLAYWRERLADAPELLELPTDRPRPPVQTYRGAFAPVNLSPELLERLQALGRSEGATLYMTLLGAFGVLLSKYSGSDDIVVGSPIAGRTRREVEELIGLFVNTLVLRTDLSGDPGFRQVLRRAREVTLGAYEHQEVPFERLVAELQPERSLSHSPLFQVMFALQNAEGPGGDLPGLEVSGAGAEFASAKFDLSLTLEATAQGLRGGVTYATDLFERGTVERMLGHLARVLEQVAADADVRLSQLELLGEAERALVLEACNRTDAEYPADRCIHELFEAQAARTPDAVAVVFADESLTYAALDTRANRLAHYLRGLGARPETRVGICVDRSAEMVVAMLAVLKSGAAYLPLDPSYPADRLAYMLEDSGAPLLVTQGSLRGLLPTDGVRIVSVDGDAAAIASNSADAPRAPVDAANAAYVIYTSGSTGRPKGVQVTHGNAVSFFAGMDERVGGPAAGTWLAVTRISFDIHVLELLWTLARGFRVVVQPEPDRVLGGESVAEQVRRHAVTHLQCTPSLAATMIAESGALPGLERILLGGEALPPELAARIATVLPNGLVNMYGPTETTVWSATHAVAYVEGPIPIGRPIANTRVYVLDAALRPQPAGVPGELFIGGPGVTRGYLGRPGLTAERFVPDAFSARPGARLYRTGDRVRWTAEGVLEYLGRLDAQVKVRGFRIEPGEIEAVLRRHPAVVECAVVARTAGAGDTRLVAYVVGAAEADALRAHVGRSLPDYMVPSAFVSLDALPLTPNGKLDRKALPAPGDDACARRGYEAPVGETEEALAGIWAEVLGLERVGRWDNFFERGGNSLLALRLFARVRRELGCDLPVATLFRGGTVRHMAEAVRAHDEPAVAPETAPLVPLRATGTLPPLFVVHPAGRRVANYAALVERLGPDQPVYGLQDVGDDLGRPVERIAAEHLRAVRAVQPHGPYHLAGWSFGGVVAYEMAVQLERAGERVAFAGVLDTVAPPFGRNRREPDDADLVLGLARDVAAQMGRPFTPSADALTGAGLDEKLRRAVEALHAQGAAPDRFDAADLRGHVEVIRARNRATAAYRPGAYGGPLTLFAAADNPVEFASWFGLRTDEEARTYGWCRLAPAARAHRVPGGHVTMGMEPHVETLAARVREELAAARAASAAPAGEVGGQDGGTAPGAQR